jgi:hypothetical protein
VGEAKKIFVIDDQPQLTTYQMERYTEAANPNHVWYKWSSTNDPVWHEAFSRNLRITRVRILRGFPSLDSTTGKYRLGSAVAVRPSRVVLTPNFSGSVLAGVNDALRCYANMSEDGNIDLSVCRRSCPACPSSGTNLEDATPTYSKTDPSASLTWFAEFNPCEGCASPCGTNCPTGAIEPALLVPGEVLAIEFTIARAN